MQFPRLPSEAEAELEVETLRALKELANHEPKSEEYGTVLDRVAKLHKMKAEERPKSVDPSTVVMSVTNLLGILMIVRHEYLNALSSKALGFVMKPR